MTTRRRQRAIRPEQWTDAGLLRAPKDARLTGIGLWGIVDDEGRAEVRADLIAGAIYPGDPTMTPETIETHLLELDESGFLSIYTTAGRAWIQLLRPLVTQRPSPSECPPPPRRNRNPESSGMFMAVGGEGVRDEDEGDGLSGREWARARAGARVRAEGDARASRWADWQSEQEQAPARPERPMLLDAPPIGCPDHPNGRFAGCGPCGTARRRHDRWVAQQRYTEELERHYEGMETNERGTE